jgi:hypothetical protein
MSAHDIFELDADGHMISWSFDYVLVLLRGWGLSAVEFVLENDCADSYPAIGVLHWAGF